MKKTLLFTFIVLLILFIAFEFYVSFNSEFNLSSELTFQVELKEGVAYFDQGYLEYREGIPFLHVKGDP